MVYDFESRIGNNRRNAIRFNPRESDVELPRSQAHHVLEDIEQRKIS